MQISLGGTVKMAIAACALSMSFSAAHGEPVAAYPEKTIKFIVPYPAGGSTDAMGRMVANRLETAWKQTTIVDNRPGASGNIGTDMVVRSAPDGYTALIGLPALIQGPFLYSKLPYNPFTSLQPVALLARSVDVFVVPAATPANNLKEFVALVKANPKKYNFGSYGNATSSHIHGEMFSTQAGIELMHVPYKGAAPLVADLLGGQITSAFVDIATIRPHMASGRVKLLAATGAKRFKIIPDVPTMTELGYKSFEPYGWFGVFVPAATPKPIVAKMAEEISKMVHSPEGIAKIEALGAQPAGEQADEFTRILKTDSEIWGRVIKETKVTMD
jgi:tripartite-type tricarboxylate transporter receptor subunit TctC